MAARKKRVPRKKPARKIALLGTTPSRFQGPIKDNDDWELWTIGPGGMDAHRWDRLFEVHGTWPGDFAEYLDKLSNIKPPQQVITMEPAPRLIQQWAAKHATEEEPPDAWLAKITGDWSANVVYPREMIETKYYRRMWFSSSIAWLQALAMEELMTHDGPRNLGFWGIDLEAGEEYISQWTGCAHLIDLALFFGINVLMPEDCGLARDIRPYPDKFETHLALTLEKKHAWLGNAVTQTENDLEAHKAEGYRWEGKLSALQEGKAPEELIKEAQGKAEEYRQKIMQIAANLNHLRGERSATQYYRRMYVWGVTDPDE